jgi:hypothetical protein
VVILRKSLALSYFHRCEKPVESIEYSSESRFGVHFSGGTPDLSLPLDRCLSKLLARVRPLCDSGGLSPIGTMGASKKCYCGTPCVHTPFTTFPQAPELCNSTQNRQISVNFRQEFFFKTYFAPQRGISP